MAPTCSVIIRAYNEERHLPRLLTGILQQTVQDLEVLLVDSGSTDATLAVASRFPVRILSISPEEFSFGRALNLACAEATGEFLVAASAHVHPVYPDWLEQLLLPFAEPQVALSYGKQRGSPDSKFSERQLFRTLYPDQSIAKQATPFCNNANAGIRRSLWEERQYNEELPGLEDLEWATWAMSQGYYVVYQAEAEVIHVHDETPGQVFNRYRREAIALKRIRPSEHFGLKDFTRLFTSNVVSDLRHAVRDRVLSRSLSGMLAFRFMQFWGTYRGFALSGPVTSGLKQTFYYPSSPKRSERSQRPDVSPIDYPGLGHPEEHLTEGQRD